MFRLIVVVYLVLSVTVASIQGDLTNILVQTIVQIAVVFGFVWGCLVLTNRRSRFFQTMIAALGTDVLISLTALPLLIWIKVDPKILPAYLLLLGLMFWQLLVMGHILRRALDKPFPYGFGLAFLFVFLSYKLTAMSVSVTT